VYPIGFSNTLDLASLHRATNYDGFSCHEILRILPYCHSNGCVASVTSGCCPVWAACRYALHLWPRVSQSASSDVRGLPHYQPPLQAAVNLSIGRSVCRSVSRSIGQAVSHSVYILSAAAIAKPGGRCRSALRVPQHAVHTHRACCQCGFVLPAVLLRCSVHSGGRRGTFGDAEDGRSCRAPGV
jgi:hypothetical protein